MVSPNVALAIASVGAVILVVAFGLGIGFMTSDSIATSGIQCNPDVLTNSGAQTLAGGFCNDDNAVTNADGEVCQIANLGLFTASYTPGCTQADATNPYALSPLLADQTGSAGDITVLFPSQTQLGALPGLLGITDVPEFESCSSFFGGDTGASGTNFASQLTTRAGAGNLNVILGQFLTGVKSSYDDGVVSFISTLDSTAFSDVATTMVNIAFGFLAGETLFNKTISDDITSQEFNLTELDPADSFATYVDSFAALAVKPGFPGPILNTVSQLIAAGLVEDPAETSALALAILGLNADSSDMGIPAKGLWADMDGTILCTNFVGVAPCTAVQYLTGFHALVNALNTASPENFGELFFLLDSTLDAKTKYFDGVNLFQAANGDPTFADDTAVSTVVNADLTAVFSTAAVTNGIQLGFDTSADLGTATGFADNATAPLSSENSGLSLLCVGVGQLPDCTMGDFLTATVSLLTLSGDTDSAASASVVQLLVSTCAAQGLGIDACFNSLTQNPGVVSPQYRAIVMGSVFGALYDVDDDTLASGEDAIIAAMITACEDDVKNLAAINTLQALAPTGTAFLALGALITIVNLVVRSDKVKIIGVVGGLLSLLGTILVIAGFLALLNAPIYASLGSEDDAELTDNTTTFALGGAFTVALAFLGGAAVGSIISLISPFLLSPKGDSSTDILGKA